MACIYPISDLQKHPAEVKSHAQSEVVHLTENGRGAYVFMSEDQFEAYVGRKCEEAVWEAGLAQAVEQGMSDVENGRLHTLDETLSLIDTLVARTRKDDAT